MAWASSAGKLHLSAFFVMRDLSLHLSAIANAQLALMERLASEQQAASASVFAKKVLSGGQRKVACPAERDFTASAELEFHSRRKATMSRS